LACSKHGRGLELEELEATREERDPIVDSPTQITLNWKPRFSSFRSIWEVMLSKPTWLRGWTTGWLEFGGAAAAIVVQQSGQDRRSWKEMLMIVNTLRRETESEDRMEEVVEM
jgi:hypothetical protein